MMLVLFTIVLAAFAYIAVYQQNQTNHNVDLHRTLVQVINLDRRRDRLKSFTTNYDQSDISHVELSRIPATDGSRIDTSDLPLSDDVKAEVDRASGIDGYRTMHHQLTPGAVGCYMSQIKAWERLAASNHEYSLIFEDDAIVPASLGKQITDFSSVVPGDWDILLFGHLCKRTSTLYPSKGFRKVRRFYLLHCYVISKKGAEKILAAPTLFPMSMQIDWYLSQLCETGYINVYATPNPVCMQTGKDTDIQVKLTKS